MDDKHGNQVQINMGSYNYDVCIMVQCELAAFRTDKYMTSLLKHNCNIAVCA